MAEKEPRRIVHRLVRLPKGRLVVKPFSIIKEGPNVVDLESVKSLPKGTEVVDNFALIFYSENSSKK